MSWSCLICMSRLNDRKECSCTLCGHLYHSNCLEIWMLSNDTCPTCQGIIFNSIKLYPSLNKNEKSITARVETKRKVREISSLKAQIEELTQNIENAVLQAKNSDYQKLLAEKLLRVANLEKMKARKEARMSKYEMMKAEKELKLAKFEQVKAVRTLKVVKLERIKAEKKLKVAKCELMKAVRALKVVKLKSAQAEKELKVANFEKMKTVMELQAANLRLEKLKDPEMEVQQLKCSLARSNAELSFHNNIIHAIIYGQQQDVEQILLEAQANGSSNGNAETINSGKKLAIFCAILKQELIKTTADNNILKDLINDVK